MVDSLNVVREALREVCHIDVHLGKLAAWSKERAEPPPGLEQFGNNVWKSNLDPESNGLKVLGTPLGSQDFIDKLCDEMANERMQLINLIPKLFSLQAAWLLLYFCVTPRINHLLRTLPPHASRMAAERQNRDTQALFQLLFGIPDQWSNALHGISFGTWVRQARLPLRLGGCGLRNAVRTSHAAYWASWADSLPDIIARFPDIRQSILTQLAAALDGDTLHTGADCLISAELAGKRCQERGWNNRPLWIDVANGARPAEAIADHRVLGEWQHGWQFYASDALEMSEWNALLRELSLPSLRSNAATLGKARLYSCMGPFSSVWLTVGPTTEALTFNDGQLQCAMRRRLGIAVSFDNDDVHGHTCFRDNTGGRLNASNRGGGLLEQAQDENDATYAIVTDSGLGSLLCLGCEVFGRWSQQCVDLVPQLARERARGLHPRVRRGMALGLQHRLWGLLGVALQKSVAQLVIFDGSGADLIQTQLEPTPPLADVVT